jgi:DNA-directed RNA polymerase subunit RPC12/RpoP
VVCPKCNFTADIPRVTRKLKLKCQECGHKFLVKPEPKSKPGQPLPTEKAPKERGSSKAPALLLLIIILAALGLAAGHSFAPELFRDLGLPNPLTLIPF